MESMLCIGHAFITTRLDKRHVFLRSISVRVLLSINEL